MNSWEELNSKYNALMHSKGFCPFLGVLNILLLLSPSPGVWPPYHIVQCCIVNIWSKQTIRLRLASNQLSNFNKLPATSCKLELKFLTTQVLNTLNICPFLNTRDQDNNINKWQVKLHTALLNQCLCVAVRKKKSHFTLTVSIKLNIYTKYNKNETQRNGMQLLSITTVTQWIQTNTEIWKKCSNT